MQRKNNNITIEIGGETEYLELPRDLYYVLGKIFKICNINVLESLLGCIYLDQDKGWTLLNRGTVIGGIKFKVETLIEGISEKDISHLRVEANKIALELNKLNELQKIILFQSENFDLMDKSNFHINKISDLENKLLITRNNKNELLRKQSILKNILAKNEDYLKYVESLGLSVRCPDGSIVELTRDNISGFEETQTVIELRVFHLGQELEKLQKKKLS